jgi:DNA-binding MarR family transcriptional regulator
MTEKLSGDPPRTRSDATPLGAGVAAHVAARAFHMMGPAAEQEWTGTEPIAWEGLLEVARQLRRGAEEVLIETFDASISMLGITGRLSRAPKRTLRQTELADAMGLSLSRVSRVIDLLEQRRLVQRRACPTDARATNVTLTRQGAALTARAQRALFSYVQAAFFGRLEPSEVETLAAVFARLLDAEPIAPGRAC